MSGAVGAAEDVAAGNRRTRALGPQHSQEQDPPPKVAKADAAAADEEFKEPRERDEDEGKNDEDKMDMETMMRIMMKDMKDMKNMMKTNTGAIEDVKKDAKTAKDMAIETKMVVGALDAEVKNIKNTAMTKGTVEEII